MAGERQLLREILSVLGHSSPEVRRFAAKVGKNEAATAQLFTENAPRLLPAPKAKPELPKYAVKPKGGQWLEGDRRAGVTRSPERLTDRLIDSQNLLHNTKLATWLERSLPRYIKRDMGTPDDPLRAIADQGGLPHIANADDWSHEVGRYIVPTNRAELLRLAQLRDMPKGEPERWLQFHGNPEDEMPWLKNLPYTDPIYGVSGLPDPMYWIARRMNEATSIGGQFDLPPELHLDSAALDRMGFAQGAEHAARINAWRVKKAEEAALAQLNNPALAVHKEYPDAKMKWVEIRHPEGPQDVYPEDDLPDDFDYNPESDNTLAVRKALEGEGEVMGHCVGDYCDDVLAGNTRIFSLRDAKGMPHVTVETRPKGPYALSEIPKDALEAITAAAKADTDDAAARAGVEIGSPEWNDTYRINLSLKSREWMRENPRPDDIYQIKGKQNRAPTEEYLPYVQDFLKSGNWGDVRELRNARMVRLPDKRFVTQEQYSEGMRKALGAGPDVFTNDPESYPLEWWKENWPKISGSFEGYAKGGGAWTRKEGQNPEGGLNAKGRASLRAQGHDIKPPVSAKLAAKSPKAAARRKSFCARMSGMPGPMKDDKGRPTRKALSLQKWDC